jgi:hypothetical protein
VLKRRPRSVRALLALVFAPALICGLLTASLVVGPASPASALPKITICLKNSTSYCLDVKDSKDVSGQPVWLYSASGSKDDHWLEAQVTCLGPMGCNSACQFTYCVAFEDAQDPSLCLAASASRGMELIPCTPGEGGTDRANWTYDDTTTIHNIFWGQNVTVFSPLAITNPVYVAYPGEASGEWQKWTGP